MRKDLIFIHEKIPVSIVTAFVLFCLFQSFSNFTRRIRFQNQKTFKNHVGCQENFLLYLLGKRKRRTKLWYCQIGDLRRVAKAIRIFKRAWKLQESIHTECYNNTRTFSAFNNAKGRIKSESNVHEHAYQKSFDRGAKLTIVEVTFEASALFLVPIFAAHVTLQMHVIFF